MALARARGDDNVVGGQALARSGYRDSVRRLEDAGAPDDGHVVLLEQEAYAVGEPPDDRAAPVHGVAEVVLQVVEGYAVLFGVAECVEHLGVTEQRLAGDASPVEANATQLAVFHHHRAHAELPGANGGDVSARPRTQNQHVVIGQRVPPLERRPRDGKRAARVPFTIHQTARQSELPGEFRACFRLLGAPQNRYSRSPPIRQAQGMLPRGQASREGEVCSFLRHSVRLLLCAS